LIDIELTLTNGQWPRLIGNRMWLICYKGFARSLQLGFLVSFHLQRFDEQSSDYWLHIVRWCNRSM